MKKERCGGARARGAGSWGSKMALGANLAERRAAKPVVPTRAAARRGDLEGIPDGELAARAPKRLPLARERLGEHEERLRERDESIAVRLERQRHQRRACRLLCRLLCHLLRRLLLRRLSSFGGDALRGKHHVRRGGAQRFGGGKCVGTARRGRSRVRKLWNGVSFDVRTEGQCGCERECVVPARAPRPPRAF